MGDQPSNLMDYLDSRDDYYLWPVEIYLRQERGNPGIEALAETGLYLWPVSSDESVSVHIFYINNDGGLLWTYEGAYSFGHLKLVFAERSGLTLDESSSTIEV